jgi:hypothetical protein
MDDHFAPVDECAGCGVKYASAVDLETDSVSSLSSGKSIKQVKEKKSTVQCPFCREEIQEAAVRCKHCKEDLNKNSNISNKKKTSPWMFVIAGITSIFIIIVINASSNYSSYMEQAEKAGVGVGPSYFMESVEKQVAQDAVKEYYIVSKHGDYMDQCVQAGFVSAAFLQANDEVNYKEWKEREETVCYLAERM